MQRPPRFDTLFARLNGRPATPSGPLQKLVAILATVVVFGLRLTFSVVVLALVLKLGLVPWGWFCCKTRELRKRMREEAAAQPTDAARSGGSAGLVIEGEVIREVREPGHDRPAGP